jgi:hypothetical protein
MTCGPKVRSKDDTRWHEWERKQLKSFYSEIRGLVKWRLDQGDSQDDVRRLLRDTPIGDIPSLPSISTPSHPPHPVIQQIQPPIQHFSDRFSNELSQINQAQSPENSFPPLATSTYHSNYSGLSKFARVPFSQPALGESAGPSNPTSSSNQTTHLLMPMDIANYLPSTGPFQFLSEPSGQLSYDPVSMEGVEFVCPTQLMNSTQFVKDSSTSPYSTDQLFTEVGPNPFFPNAPLISQLSFESEGPGSNVTVVPQHSLANASLGLYTRNQLPN